MAKIIKHRDVGEIVVNKMAGTKTAWECRNGRVVEPIHADLMETEKYVTNSVKLRCEGNNNIDCFLAFHGMCLTNEPTGRSSRGGRLSPRCAWTSRRRTGMIRMFCVEMTSQKSPIRRRVTLNSCRRPERHDEGDDGGCSLEGPQRHC